MQNRNIDSPAGAKNNQLEDDSILKFAEEVLSETDDNIFDLEDDDNLSTDNDEIIDLTELADKELQGDDDILDLTEDSEVSSESEAELLELEDIAEGATAADETLTGLDEGNDDLTLLDEAVLDLDDVVEEIATSDNDLFGQDDVDDDQDLAEAVDFLSEKETIELSESDRNSLESEFGYETSTENPPDADVLHTLSSNDIDEEILLDFSDDVSEDISDEVDLSADLDEQLHGTPPEYGPHEKLELTESDRRILEEELNLDSDGDADTLPVIEEKAVDTDDMDEVQDEDIRESLADATVPDERVQQEDSVVLAEEEVSQVAPDKLEPKTEEGDTAPEEIKQDMAPPLPEVSAGEKDSQSTEADQDLIGIISDLEPDDGGSETKTVLESDEMDDAFNLDLDDATVDSDADGEPMELPPLTPEEELSVEALLAEVDPPEESPQPLIDETKAEHPEMDVDSERKPTIEKKRPDDLDMDFDKPEATDDSDLHKVGDPISIRVKEPAAPNHADEDTLLNSVFDPAPEAADLSSAQLEAAVERAVKKIFSEKIESILIDTIDRAVTKEISRLKTLILGDRDPVD